MSSEEPVPFAEPRSPPAGGGREQRLRALAITGIPAAAMATIGPAMSFSSGFGLIAATAGLALPLAITAAAAAIGPLGSTLAQFSRAQPSTGGFITFAGTTSAGTSTVSTALTAGVGYITAMSALA